MFDSTSTPITRRSSPGGKPSSVSSGSIADGTIATTVSPSATEPMMSASPSVSERRRKRLTTRPSNMTATTRPRMRSRINGPPWNGGP